MFPNFNQYSTPLFVFMLQGLVFSGLLLYRYRQKGIRADLFIALLLMIMAWHRTTYMIGFMGWYDTFKNTKVNYALIYLGLAVGPLIYLYVRSLVKPTEKFNRQNFWHFLPVCVYFIYRVVLYLYDRSQEGFAEGYEGELMQNVAVPYIEPIFSILNVISMLLYLAFTIQLFVQHRKRITQFFSDTRKVELNWIRNFLIVYVFLFVVGFIFDLTDTIFTDLGYKQVWWSHLLNAAALIYLGFMALYSNPRQLKELNLSLNQHISLPDKKPESDPKEYQREAEKIETLFVNHTAFTNPDLTLAEVAKDVGLSSHVVSQVINSHFGVNFKEYVNRYRVEEIKNRLRNPEFSHLSIFGIAMDCGFNSKATFNRVFKAMTGLSPTEFKSQNTIEAS